MDYPKDLLPWQEKILKQFAKYKGKGVVQITGRQHGKSYNLRAMQRLMDDLKSRPLENLICACGTIFGKRYLTVEPIGGNWIEMEQWCRETFGPPSSIWETFKESDTLGRWYQNDRKFWFLNDADRMMFLLRWR